MCCVDNSKHQDCLQIDSQRGWEETGQAYRQLLNKQIQKLGYRLEVNSTDVMFQDIIGLGQALQMAFDLEQSSKVFDATIENSKKRMEKQQKREENEEKERESKGTMGFIKHHNETVNHSPFFDDDFEEDDDDFFDDDYDEEDEDELEDDDDEF